MNSQQMKLFPEPKPKPAIPEDFTKVVEHHKVRIPDEVVCDMQHMSECHGPMYVLGIDSAKRCARHITLQHLWTSTQPPVDLIDWIAAGGGDNIPVGMYAVDSFWSLIQEDE